LLNPGTYQIAADSYGVASHRNAGGGYSISFGPTPPFAITSIALQSNSVLLTWNALAGTTNLVQAAPGAADGSYSNNFLTISPPIIIPNNMPGFMVTNYLDVGGATNVPARYYRIFMGSPLLALFAAAPTNGPAPLTVTFTDNSTGAITNWFWSFGDGVTTNVSSAGITHTYTVAGTDTVQLIVSGLLGSSTNTQANLIVVAPLVALFTAAPTNGVPPLSVTFTDDSTGTITNWFWSFGDGVTTNVSSAGITHTYTGGGTYTVQLVVSGPTGSSTNTQADLIVLVSLADSAADPAYSGGWTNGSNGGIGFGPWMLTASGVIGSSSNGYFIGTSTNNAFGTGPGIDVDGKSWGIYANDNNFTAGYRAFDNSVPVGGGFKIDMDNGFIDTGNADGFVLRNGNVTGSYTNYNTGARFEFLYIGGDSSNSYKVVDNAGLYNIGVPFTGTGLHLVFTLNTADTYTLLVIDNASGDMNTVVNGTLGGAAGTTLNSLAVYNRNAGSGPDYDAFFNSIEIFGP
jgi:PKD repeat protein